MATGKATVFALLDEIDQAAGAVEALRKAGVPDDRIEIMSGIPLEHEVLGRPEVPERMSIITPVGAIIGFITAILFTFGTVALYSIRVGGQGYFTLPPKLIIMYELTMLGIILSTFFAGTFWQSGLLPFRRKLYDPSISDGRIGIVVSVSEDQRAQVEDILRQWGADIKDGEWRPL